MEREKKFVTGDNGHGGKVWAGGNDLARGRRAGKNGHGGMETGEYGVKPEVKRGEVVMVKF
jgi:hypothetical protein